MKLLVISDTHLNLPFSFTKYTLLKELFTEADKIILNGDFWEGYIISFDQFMNSQWKKIFPILKSKKTIYIYGNHDKKMFSDERVFEFSERQLLRYEEKIGSHHFIFEHGNRVIPLIDDSRKWNKPLVLLIKIAGLLHGIMVHLFGNTFLQIFFGRFNNRGIRNLKKELRPGQIFVCGHTHAKRIDLKNQFVNSGVSKYGVLQWLWIDEKGQISPGETWYHE